MLAESSLVRSLALAQLVLVLTVVMAVMAGLAFRRGFVGATLVFYLAVASLVMPGLLVGLGIGLMCQLLGLQPAWYTSVLGEGIHLRVPHGRYCCLLGPSGCGKTTLLRLMAGHETPTTGDVRIGGESVVGLPPVRRGTATMFQQYALFPHLTVLDN